MARRSICLVLIFVMLLFLTGCLSANGLILSTDAPSSPSATALLADSVASSNKSNDTTEEIGALYKGVPLLIPEQDVFFFQASRIDDSIFLLGSSKDISYLYKTDISGSQIEKIEYNGSETFYSICENTEDYLTLLGIDENGNYLLVTQRSNDMWEKITLPMLQEYEESTITKIFKIEGGYVVFTTAEILILDEKGNLVKNMGSYYSFGTCIPQEDKTILLITEIKSMQRNGEQITRTQILDANYNVLDSYTSDSQFSAFYKDLDSSQSTVLAEKDDIIYRFDYKNDTKQALINTLSSSMHINSLWIKLICSNCVILTAKREMEREGMCLILSHGVKSIKVLQIKDFLGFSTYRHLFTRTSELIFLQLIRRLDFIKKEILLYYSDTDLLGVYPQRSPDNPELILGIRIYKI